MTALTNTAIEAMRPGDVLKDDRVPGLSIRCHASGRSFMLYYRTHGRQRRPKIGNYGAITLAQARDIARNMLADVAAGGDPGGARLAARAAPTVDALWDRCERDHWNRGKTWDKEAKRIYQRDVKPRLGRELAAAIDYASVKRVHDALAASPVQANRAVAVIGKMLNLAERWGLRPLGSNPCRHLSRNRERSRRRYATADEIPVLVAAIEKAAQDPVNLPGCAFLYLLIFSGARPSEIGRATPAQLERVTRGEKVFGVLRLAEAKTGPRDVFLPPQAMVVLDRLPAKRTSLAGRTTTPRKLWYAIRKEAGCTDLWMRDWRRTWATVALSNGMPLDVLGGLMGHADPKTTKIYAKLIEDKAHDAAAGVADRMQELMTAAT